MEEHVVDMVEQVVREFQKSEQNSVRLINQEPERLGDKSFVQICNACEGVGIAGLPDTLQPLMVRLLGTDVQDAEDGEALPEVMEERGLILKEIVSEVLDRIDEFSSLEQYIWLVKFSCGLCLLKNLPIGMSFEINKVIRSVAGLDTEGYEFCPVTVHTISKSLFEDISLEGMNLVHVVKKLTVLNQKLFYYVSIALIFAGIHHYIHPGEPISMYRLFGFDDVLSQLGQIRPENFKLKKDIREFFLILKLLSCYQNAVILRHSLCSWQDLQEQHEAFAEFFRFSAEQKKTFVQWLMMARNIVANLNAQHGMQDLGLKEDLMMVSELIEFDMIALMEDDTDEEVH
ncbi:uncharacterized protein LOC134217557 [Armigeres subalbatus]|uniref:uncharacterized protein LOC134217557 n=1 Tax=Armigeres subalbatus TaxID=124917 RepID=UPI002ED2D795